VPANDTNSRIKQLRIEAQDKNRTPESRLSTIRTLLTLGGSTRTIRIAKSACAELLEGELSEDLRARVSGLQTKLLGGFYDNATPNERDDLQESAVITTTTERGFTAVRAAVPSNPQKATPPSVTAESARKRAAFLEASEKFGILSREALHAASEWEYQRSYLDKQQQQF
jgi:hypothetical protein